MGYSFTQFNILHMDSKTHSGNEEFLREEWEREHREGLRWPGRTALVVANLRHVEHLRGLPFAKTPGLTLVHRELITRLCANLFNIFVLKQTMDIENLKRVSLAYVKYEYPVRKMVAYCIGVDDRIGINDWRFIVIICVGVLVHNISRFTVAHYVVLWSINYYSYEYLKRLLLKTF